MTAFGAVGDLYRMSVVKNNIVLANKAGAQEIYRHNGSIVASVSANQDYSKLAFVADANAIDRYGGSYIYDAFLYDRITKKLDRITQKQHVREVHISADASAIAFVANGDHKAYRDSIYVANTKDKTVNRIR